MVTCCFNAVRQKQIAVFLFIGSQGAFFLSQALENKFFPGINQWIPVNTLDFICGFLIGFSIVTCLAFLVCAGMLFKSSVKG